MVMIESNLRHTLSYTGFQCNRTILITEVVTVTWFLQVDVKPSPDAAQPRGDNR